MLLKRCQISISLHPKILFSSSFVTPRSPIGIWWNLLDCPDVFRYLFKFVLVCSCLMMDVHAWYSLGPKEILSNNTYILQIYIYIMHWVSMLISIHSKSKYMSYIIISHQIIEENLISQQKKQQRGQAVTKFKPTKQGQIYTLQTSTYLILQTNPLPLQISNGENMKFLWDTKLKMIENQKGLALQRWI